MQIIHTENAPGAIGPYSQAVVTGGLVYTSGQIPVDPATGAVPEGIAAQADQSCRNVGAILTAAGSGFDKVVKTTCFLATLQTLPPLTRSTPVTLSPSLPAAA